MYQKVDGFRLDLTRWLTSKVLVKVTIGIGELICRDTLMQNSMASKAFSHDAEIFQRHIRMSRDLETEESCFLSNT